VSSHITERERAMIDAAIAAGKVRIIPEGENTASVFIWSPEKGQLVLASGESLSWRVGNKVGAKNWARKVRQATILASQRRERVRDMAAQGMTMAEMAAHEGVSYELIKKDCKRGDIEIQKRAPIPKPEPKPARRPNPENVNRVLQAALDNPGWGAWQIAHATGLSRTMASKYLSRLRAAGKLPAYDKRASRGRTVANPYVQAITGPRNQDRAVATSERAA